MGIYEPLTKYLVMVQNDSIGEWIVDNENKGFLENPKVLPFVMYSRMVDRFIEDVYNFVSSYPEYHLNNYTKILEENNIEWATDSMRDADVSKLDAQCILALIVGAVRADRFCDGALLRFFKDGAVERWLLRLEELDK